MSAIWITGASGFAGTWLRRTLDERDQAWAALTRSGTLQAAGTATGNGASASRSGVVAALDLEDVAERPESEPIPALDELPEPAGLVHLAAVASPPACEEEPEMARAVHVDGPARLYREVFARWPRCPVVHVSTAYVYAPGPRPLREDDEPRPVNAYGRSKLAGERSALQFRAEGHPVTVVRPFNHSGPGQRPQFALPSFALRLAALEAEGGGALPVGRLDSVRDFLHVRDVVDGYLRILARAGETDCVNLCSGEGVRMQDLLDGLLERFDAAVTVERDEARLRGAADADRLVGDVGRLRELLGAAPRFERERLLDELVDDARARIAAGESVGRA